MFYLVFVELLNVHWCECVASASPFVEILGEEAFQVDTATLIQIVNTGQYTGECNTATKHNTTLCRQAYRQAEDNTHKVAQKEQTERVRHTCSHKQSVYITILYYFTALWMLINYFYRHFAGLSIISAGFLKSLRCQSFTVCECVYLLKALKQAVSWYSCVLSWFCTRLWRNWQTLSISSSLRSP